MKRTLRTEDLIIGILQEHEAGAKCAGLCRQHGMPEGTCYASTAKNSGMTVSEARWCMLVLSRNCAAPGARLGHLPFESDGTFFARG